ncbi:MAG TPA: outer membrane protein assembly factor BamD [Candidatus Sulfotelmatobacter sp.]|nr:outer membrane protein assembly factor BamD [Candidatus Sulfotelmatobacter sp.]
MRRTLLACITAVAFLAAVSATAQNADKSKKPKKKKEEATATDNSAAPDKVLYDRAMKDIKKGRQEVGRLTLQTLINTYPDSEFLAKAKLAIADSYYKEGGTANLTQAVASYKDFIVFFPFLPEAPYAQMQVAMTHYKQMEKPDRDRTEARAAEDEFQTFLQKYPNDPLVPQTAQHLRDVQEILAEGDFRIGYYYYVKGDRRAAAGRLISVTKRYPLYSKADRALWMLGDIFEKSEKKEIAAIYLGRIVREYPLSPLAGDAKNKLVAYNVPVPQPDPKALAWMQAEQSASRPKPGVLSKPMSLVKTGPGKELMVAARSGAPNLQPDADTTSATDILTGGGGQTRIAGAGGSSPTANTAVVEVATPGSGASGGSTVEAPADSQSPATDADPNASGAPPATDSTATPAAGATATDASGAAGTGTAATDPAQPASGQSADTSKTDAGKDNGKESTSKKKKGIKKIVPW